MKRTWMMACAAALAACVAWAQNQQIVSVKGRGRSAEYKDALNDALAQALGQVQGITMQTVQDVVTDSLKGYTTANGATEAVHQTLQQKVVAKTAGRIQSFEITTEAYDRELKSWLIEVVAQVPGPYVLGDPKANKRRRMIVMPFRAVGTGATVYGVKAQPGPLCEEVASKLNDTLTQTRRFNMLNREFDEAILAELSRLNMDSSSANDLGRFKQLLVTDYMVIGTVKLFDSPAVSVNPYTGSTVASDGPFVEISYRVIVVPTSQQKWSGTIVVPYSLAGGGSFAAMASVALAAAADRICNQVVECIYPMRVTAKTAFELVLNQGGMNVRPGETLEVFRAGEKVVDVSSGESLGAVEEMIARVRVTRVTPKMSYAQVVEGTEFAAVPVGAIVRRPQAMPYAGAAAPVGTESPVKTTTNGVIPPWSRK